MAGATAFFPQAWTDCGTVKRLDSRGLRCAGHWPIRSAGIDGQPRSRACDVSSPLARLQLRHRKLHEPGMLSTLAGHRSRAPPNAAGGMWPGSLVVSPLPHLKPGILAATVSATCKLFLICGAVAYLMRSKRLPDSTPEVLSKLAFQLLIPSLLFTKVVAALAQNPEPALLLVPISAVVLIVSGLCLGLLAAAILERGVFSFQKAPLLQPKIPAQSAEAIAASTSAAVGKPAAAQIIGQKPQLPPQGLTQMLIAACGFGNSLTLPLVFMLTLLPTALADSATAYVALFLLGWSPCFWSIGYSILTSSQGRNRNRADSMRVAGPFDTSLVPAGNLNMDRAYTKAGQRVPTLDPGPMGPEQIAVGTTPGAQLARLLWSCWPSIQGFASRVVNPPLIAILAAVTVGLSPLGKVLCFPAGHHDVAQWTGNRWGAAASGALLWGGLQALWEVMTLLGSSTLAVQAIVLAASMVQNKSQTPTSSKGPTLRGAKKSWERLLLPADALETRALLLVSVVRLLVMPLVGLGLVCSLSSMGLLPRDPVCLLSILLQSAMPSAQNLVLMTQLSDDTRPLAPTVARLTLQQYLVAIIPITMWAAIFAAFTGVQLR